MLFLSGGSQNGAFGAGFLAGWHKRKPAHGPAGLPKFSLVTGVSTGALQATFAFIGEPEKAVQGYTIAKESDLLDTYVNGSAVSDGLSPWATLTALRRGAVADLAPLRKELGKLLTKDVLEAVGTRYDPEGKDGTLLVGVTDVKLGQAVAFDMTELASRYSKAETDEKRNLFKDCYIEALVASSIVPPAAKPVFIDNRMYIDGGVRYAVFDDQIGKILQNNKSVVPGLPIVAPPPGPDIYMILNGDGERKVKCKSKPCNLDTSLDGKPKNWDALSVALRAIELMEDQVQRLSIDRVERRAGELNSSLYFARMRAHELGEGGNLIGLPDFAANGEQTCSQWQKDDDKDGDPVQFHRRYMRCLIEYGRQRGKDADWDQPISTSPAAPLTN
jgi:hypothetical protein